MFRMIIPAKNPKPYFSPSVCRFFSFDSCNFYRAQIKEKFEAMWGNTLMNSLFYVSSAGAGAVFSKTSHFITRSSSLLGFSSYVSSSSWKSRINHAGIKATNLDVMLTRFHVQTYSSSARSSSSSSKSKKLAPAISLPMEEDKNTFYIVRKGDIVGVYKSLSDCQAQVGNSVCDPSVSVFKGHSLPKVTEEYLKARGLKNPLYTINAADVNDDLFGDLVPCPFQEPLSKDKTADKVSPPKRSLEVLGSSSNTALTSLSKDPSRKQIKLDSSVKEQISCTLQFDGASKGNPGLAGAGAVLRSDDGRLVYRLREGVGIATNNVAEYRAMILGLKQALKKGFKRISVRGDSKLVCMQLQGLWKTKNENMATLCKEAKELKEKFHSFDISHVLREFNSEADAQANLACNLLEGDVQVECEQA